MTEQFLLKGMIIGFSVAAPVGPIGVLCIRRSLMNGMWVGLATGLGAATADAAYGSIAAFGLTMVSTFLVNQRSWLGLVGGIFLCFLGIRTFITRPNCHNETRARDFLSAYISTLMLTLTNPMTTLSFVAIFAGFGLETVPDIRAGGKLIAGVFLGSSFWWLLLNCGVGLIHSRLKVAFMRSASLVAGCVLTAFGIYALAISLIS